jgi:hypothetical protein
MRIRPGFADTDLDLLIRAPRQRERELHVRPAGYAAIRLQSPCRRRLGPSPPSPLLPSSLPMLLPFPSPCTLQLQVLSMLAHWIATFQGNKVEHWEQRSGRGRLSLDTHCPSLCRARNLTEILGSLGRACCLGWTESCAKPAARMTACA